MVRSKEANPRQCSLSFFLKFSSLSLRSLESLAISRPVDIKRGACFSDEVRQFEVSLIRTALGRTSGSQTRAAKLLGLKPTTLNAKIKRYGIMA